MKSDSSIKETVPLDINIKKEIGEDDDIIVDYVDVNYKRPDVADSVSMAANMLIRNNQVSK